MALGVGVGRVSKAPEAHRPATTARATNSRNTRIQIQAWLLGFSSGSSAAFAAGVGEAPEGTWAKAEVGWTGSAAGEAMTEVAGDQESAAGAATDMPRAAA